MPERGRQAIVAAAGLLLSALVTNAAADDGSPSLEELTAVCRYVESIPPDKVSDYAIRSGVFDADGDGVAETVTGTSEGTMGVEVPQIRDAGGNAIEILPAYDWSDYWTLGQRWLLYDGRAYGLHFAEEAGQFLAFVSYVDRQRNEHVGCEFDTDVKETVLPQGPDDRSLCDSLGAGQFEAFPIAPSDPEPVSDRENTIQAGTVRLDFDNDGVVEELVALDFESGAGRGCDATYYDLREAMAGAADARKRSLLMRLQGVDPDDVIPARPCGVDRHWLTRAGRNYFEVRYRGEAPEADSEAVRWLATIVDGEPVRVCGSSFLMQWRLERIAPSAE